MEPLVYDITFLYFNNPMIHKIIENYGTVKINRIGNIYQFVLMLSIQVFQIKYTMKSHRRQG